MATRTRLTIEQYLALPEWEKPYREYVGGEAVPKAVPDYRHVDLCDELQSLLRGYRALHGGKSGPEGRVEFAGSDGPEFRLPDVAYWPAERPRQGPRAMNPPLLAIEVRSPGQALEALRTRCRFMQGHGVSVCWLVDPDNRVIEVFEDDRDGDVFASGGAVTSPRLPGFSLDVSRLFAILDE
jgi:Uma2 family endonuclease